MISWSSGSGRATVTYMPERSTMSDVAALAGVSRKTVSRVVNREAGVSEDLVRRIERASMQLGYRHNLAASNLRRGQRTLSVALLVQDLSNDYSAAVLRSIDDAVRDRGVVVLSASLDEEEVRERELVANLIARRVDGLILMPASRSQQYLQPDVAAGFAVVTIDRPPSHLAADSVVVDNIGGAREATAHLLARGHTRIALVTDELTIRTARDRAEGFGAAMKTAGIAVDPSLTRTARTVQAARLAVSALLSSADPPTAIFAARNTATVGAAITLKELGVQNTVALVGFDELRLADLVDPGITNVEQNPGQIGAEAARLLLARLDGSAGPPQALVLPTSLHPRGSGEIRPPIR